MKRLELKMAIGILGGAAALLISAPSSTLLGCATARSLLAVNGSDEDTRPINNPFGDIYATSTPEASGPIILRTKKGDRSVEIELPRQEQDMTDFVIPVSPAFKDDLARAGGAQRGLASSYAGDSTGVVPDSTYREQTPTMADREIVAAMPQGAAEDSYARHEIESGLGLTAAEDPLPNQDKSYLAGLDQIKQLYRGGRYEAALIEVDTMLRVYQTDAKLYEMRGTLLDRLGKRDLAIKSWSQALRFKPDNVSLRRFVERKKQSRSLASP